MAAMMTIRGFPSSLPEAEIKGLLETIGKVSHGSPSSPVAGLSESKHASAGKLVAHVSIESRSFVLFLLHPKTASLINWSQNGACCFDIYEI